MRRQWQALVKHRNAEPNPLRGSLRASRWAVIHGVAPASNSLLLLRRRALWLTAQRLAE
ncbi:MAG: hypothetical protein KZQ95_02825 [Candidatus Thiodiazotropha sp. (ex Epidulcina cf. delphinae)]|nr:hypothetical protein [Candidatus Thiodiazotropha sp. (ex Epidulcina cf. delphinae)]